MRGFEAADKTGDSGRGHAKKPRGPGEGGGFGDAENDDSGAQSVHSLFDTSGWFSRNTVYELAPRTWTGG